MEADALHFASDIWATLAVLLGLTATWIGERYHIPWLHYADPVAAIAVSVLILRFSWELATQDHCRPARLRPRRDTASA